MIRVILPSRTLGLTFQHEKIIVPLDIGGVDWFHRQRFSGPSHRWERRTKCEIVECDPTNDKKFTIIGEGVAKCHHKDNFVKEVGRKLALTNAMRIEASNSKAGDRKWVWTFTKFDRTMIWQAYFDRDVEAAILDIERLMRDEVKITSIDVGP